MPVAQKSCRTCGASFAPTSNRQVYCSSCGRRGRATCKSCGVEFAVVGNTRGLFCSRRCFGDSLALPRRPCAVCGTDFKPRSASTLCCSRACGAVLVAERTRRERLVRSCAVCGLPFDATKHPHRRFCSRLCSGLARRVDRQACERCGGPVSFQAGYAQKRFCSPECRKTPLGTRRVNGGGYVEVKVEQGWRQEHRVVMEGVVGRPLLKAERVHHRNGIRDDNRPENLELWVILPHSKKDPAGQRVADLIAFVAEHYPEQVRAAAA